MDVKRRMKLALNAVEDAIGSLKRARGRSDEARSDIDRSLRELDALPRFSVRAPHTKA